MNGKPIEGVLEGMQGARDPRGNQAQQDPENHVKDQTRQRNRGNIAHFKDRARAGQEESQSRRRRAGHHDWNDGPGSKFEEQKFNGEQHRRRGAAERRGHAGRGPRRQQGLAFRRRSGHELPEQRTESTSRRDDRAFRSEGAARADRNGRGKRFEQRHACRNAAVMDEDLFHRLGNAVTSNRLGTEAGHQADDESADNGNDDHPQAQRVFRRADLGERPTVEERHVGKESDQPHQHEGGARGRRTQADRHGAQANDAEIDDRRLERNLCRLGHQVERRRDWYAALRPGMHLIYLRHPRFTHRPMNRGVFVQRFGKGRETE